MFATTLYFVIAVLFTSQGPIARAVPAEDLADCKAGVEVIESIPAGTKVNSPVGEVVILDGAAQCVVLTQGLQASK